MEPSPKGLDESFFGKVFVGSLLLSVIIYVTAWLDPSNKFLSYIFRAFSPEGTIVTLVIVPLTFGILFVMVKLLNKLSSVFKKTD